MYKPAFLLRFALAGFMFCAIMAHSIHARAQDCEECTCAVAAHAETQYYILRAHLKTREFFGTALPVPLIRGKGLEIGTEEMGRDERWWIDVFLIENVIPAMQMMTEQFVTMMMNQMMSIGAFMDAKQQLETQLLFQKLTVEAHKDYRPSSGMCTIGTAALSLAASERVSEMTSSVLAEHTIKHALGNGEISGAESEDGGSGDRGNRLARFAQTFCDFDDNDRIDTVANTGLFMVCDRKTHDGDNFAMQDFNRDIDFTRAVATPDTINMTLIPRLADNLPDSIFLMKQYLYGHNLMQRIGWSQLKAQDNMDDVVDYRSVAAKRSVASSSFETLVGMKAEGTPDGAGTGRGSANTLEYMHMIMRDLGIPDAEVASVLGDRPSYYAQLKFLAKRLYQRPEFYSDLYDTPANVNRRKVALQAINSILEREMYNSSTRSEAIMSQILELQVDKQQQVISNAIRNLDMNQQ